MPLSPILIAALAVPLSPPAAGQAMKASPRVIANPMPDRCGGNRIAGHVGRRAGPSPLAQQPPAARLYALYRTVDGCPRPIVLREGIGAHPERRLPIVPDSAVPR
ncbi:hypothetical protein M9980_07970 [Sphingomonas donggukensis]|uniref:Uncharacterized protein n=1 Tax=Sphingomonas donggukensis TaxID=2949093 RepID=A0ABY4TQ53_9SPHN|nr:hypothetical protein [Sphingomonas donggukensis]URW74519.1 hypothetical protein M9980_07970 [Sphingomonas donggukensis]